MHAPLLLLVLHFVVPLEEVRQQVTKPFACLPQIERAAHLLTAPRHSFGSEVFAVVKEQQDLFGSKVVG